MTIYVDKGSSTWRIYEGTVQEAAKLGLWSPYEFHGNFGPLTIASQDRPDNFSNLPPEIQWVIDKKLGILDWTGKPEE